MNMRSHVIDEELVEEVFRYVGVRPKWQLVDVRG